MRINEIMRSFGNAGLSLHGCRGEENDHERSGHLKPIRANARSLEQGKADRCEAAAPAETREGHIDSKLRGCDLVSIRVGDVAPRGYAVDRASVRQRKTGHPVKFELTEATRQSLDDYLRMTGKQPGEFLFTGPRRPIGCLTTRQYARLLLEWLVDIGLDPRQFGTHSLRRTKATLIYKKTANLRAVNCFSGIRKSKARYGISASRSTTQSPSQCRSRSEL
jgi:integrase